MATSKRRHQGWNVRWKPLPRPSYERNPVAYATGTTIGLLPWIFALVVWVSVLRGCAS